MNSRGVAIVFAFAATLIYGVSFTVAKEVMPEFVKPFGFIMLRVTGATLLFWLVSLFVRKEHIEFKDYPRILLAAIFGIALNQLTFFKGLSITTPISASVIMVSSPILVLSFSVLILREKATRRKLSGIFIGMIGAVVLIVFGKEIGNAPNATVGNLLVFVNASSYSLYLILIRNLTQKYHPITLAKWLYLLGMIMVIPFGFEEFRIIEWQGMPEGILYRIGFIIVFTSFLTYMLNLFAIRKLLPTTLSIFIYLQPVIATAYALLTGSDQLNLIKILSTLLIFTGVFLVTSRPKREMT